MGLRDGLQSIAAILPTARKIEWIRDAYVAGQREIEVGSFVPAKLLPQLADTDQLVAYAKTLPGLTVSVLVPNLKGAQRALECGADVMLLPLSASRAHSLANLRKPPDDVVAEIARIRAARDAAGSPCVIEVGLSTAFGCTIQGRVEPDEVLRLLQAALDAGADRVGLADTVGYADPAMVRSIFSNRRCDIAGERVACGHFHDTRGLGLANVYSAWQVGISRFDACLAGHRRLSARAGRERQRHHRRRRLHVRQHGRADRPGLRPAARAAGARWRAGSTAKRCTARCGAPACRRRWRTPAIRDHARHAMQRCAAKNQRRRCRWRACASSSSRTW